VGEGVGGEVIFDFAGTGKSDPAGAAEWRQMMRDIAAPTDRIFLVGCPPVFVERLTKEEDLGGKAQVLTFAMPYTCAKCATTASQLVEVEQHFDVLKFATPPEMKCQDCGGDTMCAASDALLAHLAALPRPASDGHIKKLTHTMRETTRLPPTPPGPTGPAEMQVGFQQAQRAQNRMTLLFGGALLVLVVLGGILLWKATGSGVLREDEGTLLEASEGKPPA